MIAPMQIAMSGLVAARNRAEVAANNIVNAQNKSPARTFPKDLPPEASAQLSASLAYAPQRAINKPARFGGVIADRQPIEPGSYNVYNPDSPEANSEGYVSMPNVSIAEEMVQMRVAANAYKANAAVMRTANEMEGALLDAVS